MNELMEEYLKHGTGNENANENFSNSGLQSYIAGKILAEDYIEASPLKDLHKRRLVHVHDARGGRFLPYCCGLSLSKLLTLGLANPTGSSSKPAKHFDTAMSHLGNMLGISQQEFSGAQAFSFHPNTPIVVRRNDIVETYSIEQLFKMYEYGKIVSDVQEVIYEPFKQSYSMDDIRAKHSKLSLMDNKFIFQNDVVEILDKDGFVPVRAISRHVQSSASDELIKIQTNSGKILIVTRAHPMFLKDRVDTVPAGSLNIGDTLVRLEHSYKLNGNISLDESFAWLLGYMIAEGGSYGHQVVITQKDTSFAASVAESLGLNVTISKTKNSIGSECESLVISSTSLGRLITSFFGMRKYAWNKNLPSMILDCDLQTIGAIISGYVDGDGTVGHYDNKSSMVRITSTSYTMLSQIQSIFDTIGIVSTISMFGSASPNKNGIVSKHDAFTMRFRIDEEFKYLFNTCNKIDDSFRWKVRATPEKDDIIVRIESCLWQPDYVYDITTDSGSFNVNNLLVHNSDVDVYLSPFIRYDGLKYSEVKQAWQQVIYDLNFPRREGYQTVFCNLSFDLECPAHLKDDHVIRGGELQSETYSEFQPEMDICNLAFLDVMYEGDRHNKPFSFPIPTYYASPTTNWDSPVVNRIFELAAKFGLPYFSNSIGTGRKPGAIRSQCCRLSLDMEEIQQLFDTSGRGIWDLGDSTGSIAVTTINMGQVGWQLAESEDKEESVIRMLDNFILPPIKEHHIWKRDNVEWGLANGLFPFTKNYLANFSTYFSTVCILGMNECCLNLFGKPIHECQEFVVNILNHLRTRLREFCVETGFLWNMEEAPAEGISYSLAMWDKAHYPGCALQGEGDGVYYTNSSHCAVGEDISIVDEIRCQEKFKPIYNGGVLQHLFIGEGSPDPMGVKDLIRNICTNTKIPYIAFTKSYAICNGCGMTDDLSGLCPKCGGVTDVFSRVTGYYRAVSKYSDGKKAEFAARTQHSVGEFS